MKTVLNIASNEVTLENVVRKGSEVSFSIGKKSYAFKAARLPDGSWVLEQGSKRTQGAAWPGKGFKRVQVGGLEAKVSEPSAAGSSDAGSGRLSPVAPMPGLVRQILVKKGDKVKAGQPVAILEAMKLQTTLTAGGDATVEAVLVKEGEMIAEGTELVRLKGK